MRGKKKLYKCVTSIYFLFSTGPAKMQEQLLQLREYEMLHWLTEPHSTKHSIGKHLHDG